MLDLNIGDIQMECDPASNNAARLRDRTRSGEGVYSASLGLFAGMSATTPRWRAVNAGVACPGDESARRDRLIARLA
jgi:hypothetical protein